MIIHKMNIPIYGMIIVTSILIGIIYINHSLKKEDINKQYLKYYYLLYIVFSIFFGKYYTMILSKETFLTAGFSSYGGALGVLLASIIFGKIVPTKYTLLKYSILSFPLVYGLSKIGCFLAGCCYGIPYDGFLSITYIDILKESVFPIQLLETICFLGLFFYINHNKKNKNIVEETILLSAITKFLLDFLRYEHTTLMITLNQILSMLMIIIVIVLLFYKKKRHS